MFIPLSQQQREESFSNLRNRKFLVLLLRLQSSLRTE